MNPTKYINLKPWSRRARLEEDAEAVSTITYKEKITRNNREDEIQQLIEAARKNNFPKAREHAENLHNGIRNTTGPIFKFSDPEKKQVGYYDQRGYLITSDRERY